MQTMSPLRQVRDRTHMIPLGEPQQIRRVVTHSDGALGSGWVSEWVIAGQGTNGGPDSGP